MPRSEAAAAASYVAAEVAPAAIGLRLRDATLTHRQIGRDAAGPATLGTRDERGRATEHHRANLQGSINRRATAIAFVRRSVLSRRVLRRHSASSPRATSTPPGRPLSDQRGRVARGGAAEIVRFQQRASASVTARPRLVLAQGGRRPLRRRRLIGRVGMGALPSARLAAEAVSLAHPPSSRAGE